MDRRWLAFLPGVLILLMPPLLLWPLPLAGGEALITAPWSEGPAHLWGYWAAQQAGQFDFQADLIAYPQGQDFQLIDPLHLVPFGVGSALGGPALGYNFVLCFGLMVAGLAGYLLARVTGADLEARILGTCVGLSVPGLLAIGVDGITEGMGAGWVGIQLAALLHLAKSPTRRGVVWLGLAGGACAWSGAYNAVWMALVDIPVLVWSFRATSPGTDRRRAPWKGIGLSMLIASPYLLSAGQLSGDRPGSEARIAPMLPDPSLPWRGSWREGADVLDLVVPGFLTPGSASAPTTAYLGLVLIAAVVLGARRWGGARPWLLGATGMALLSLGPWWVFGGTVLEIGGWAPPALAGLLEEIPILDRISRWYRAGAVAVLLAIPVAIRALPSRRILYLAPLVILDGRLGAPLPVPLPQVSMPGPSELPGIEGPIAEIPRGHPMFPPEHPDYSPDRVADLNLIYQVVHGQPTSASLNQVPLDADVSSALRALESNLLSPTPDSARIQRGRSQLWEQGYRTLWVYSSAMRHAPEELELYLGSPLTEGTGWSIYALSDSSLAGEPVPGH